MESNCVPSDRVTDTELTRVERDLAELWREVLQTESPPLRTDNFLAAGGDSMTLSLLASRITEEIGVEVPIDALINCDSFQDLAALIQSRVGNRQ